MYGFVHMKNYTFIIAILLVFFLSSAASAPAKSSNTGRAAVTGSLRSSEQSLITPKYTDCFATETVELSVPAPLRVVRKINDRQQKLSVEIRNALSDRIFSGIQSCSPWSILARIKTSLSTPLPLHNADYLRFGILVI